MLLSYLHCFELFFSLLILATFLDSTVGCNLSLRSCLPLKPKWGGVVIAKMTHQDSVQGITRFDFSHVRPSSTGYEQNIAAQNLVRRVIGDDAARKFNITVNKNLTESEKDAFHLFKKGGNTVSIVGNTVTGTVSGFYYYLKHYLNCHISWDYDQLELPDTYPDVDIYIKFPERFRLFQNVCTQSYSYVWWNWTRWEREIDRWALNGFNLVYASTGIEAVWTKVYRELGLSQRDIDDYFSGPAFLAWNHMGNVRGWGGPLSDAWHSGQGLLQRRILSRLRELSITPILPAFSGIVPNAFHRLYPYSKLSELSRWCHFEDKYCCPLLLDPSDDLFSKVGTKFLKEVIAQFGTNHMYSADTFNENIPQHGDVDYLANVSKGIYQAMSNVDSDAIWVLQGWMFVNKVLFWTQDKVKAFLTAVPQGKILVLDLFAEQIPAHDRLHSFYGQPYIWCMLHNYGGTLGMHGSLPKVNKDVHQVRNTPDTMVGLGMVPEGINQNYVVYDFMADVFWSTDLLNLTSWLSNYARRRYGVNVSPSIVESWHILGDTLYSYNATLGALHGMYKIGVRPCLRWTPETWYDSHLLFKAWGLILNESHPANYSSNYNYDLVDITRQSLQVIFFHQFEILLDGFQTENVTKFSAARENIIQILTDMNEILGTEKKFLLGVWLNSAKSAASNVLESHIMEQNARNQITLWGPKGEIVDYATKQWSGLVSSYFLPRWSLFLDYLNTSLATNTSFDQNKYNTDVLNNIEKPFTYSLETYPDTPSGDSYQIGKKLYQFWSPKVSAFQTPTVARVPLLDYSFDNANEAT